MAGQLVSITRYPVKGLSGEELPSVSLIAGRGVPGDRRYALALAETPFDAAHPVPLPKTRFAVLVRFARLAGLRSRYDEATTELTLCDGSGVLASGRLDAAAGRAAIEAAIAGVLGQELSGPPRLVEAPGHRFTDVSVVSPEMMEAVSVINLASIRELEGRLGRTVDPRRFRGNFLIDALEPWAEFDWVDRDLQIGEVAFRGARRTRRCAATEVDPVTAVRDIKLPAELLRHFGHADMGVYLYVRSPGTLRLGDGVGL